MTLLIIKIAIATDFVHADLESKIPALVERENNAGLETCVSQRKSTRSTEIVL